MALEGALSKHGIAEILQLVSTQNKTGVLEVSQLDDAPDVKISFSSGRIIRCDVDGRARGDSLGARLLAAGIIDRAQLDAAVKEQKKTLSRLEDILVVRGAADREVLSHMRGLQVRERIYTLFTHHRGRYRFDPRPPNFTKVMFDPVSAESVLMEGLRMAEEWPLIRTRINNYDAVFRKVKDADEGQNEAQVLEQLLDDAFSEFVEPDADAGGRKPGGLTRQERRVLDLVDSKRTVRDIVARARLGEFEACKALYTLLQNGFVEPVKRFRPRASPQLRSGARWRRMSLRVVVNLMVLAGLVALFYKLPQSSSALRDNTIAVAGELGSRLRANRLEAVATALEIYRLEHGAFPDALDVLVEEHLVDPALLIPDGRPLDFVSIGTDYVLR